MKRFEIQAKLKGFYYMEDPKCPSYWQGSGVYDIEVPCEQNVSCTVWAEDEDRAKEMLENYDFDKENPYIIIVEDIDFKSVSVTGEDDGEEEIFSVDYSVCEDLVDEPDPDDYREERR